MAENTKAIPRGENRVPLPSIDDFFSVKAEPSAFAGGTANSRGDEGGTSDPLTLFTATGDVLVGVFGVCTTDLASAGGGTVSVGVTDNVTLFIGATTATEIDENEVFLDTAPAIGEPIDGLNYYIVGNGEDIVEATGTADVTAGQIYYIALWRPLSPGSTVEAV